MFPTAQRKGKYMRKSLRQNGISMIEVLVTLFITSIAITGLAALQIKAIKATNDTSQSSAAMWVLQDLMERIKSNTAAALTGAYSAQLSRTQDCAQSPAKFCAPYFNGTQKNADACNAAEIATFDLWDVMCGASSSADTNGHQAYVLINPKLSVECVTAECQQYQLDLNWQSQDTATIDNQVSFFVEVTP
jgi:type IV pilus assembly protein PilV